jgi:hypothetical protein
VVFGPLSFIVGRLDELSGILAQRRLGEAVKIVTAKEELRELLDNQPEDSSKEELIRELAFHVMIKRGLADSDAERTITNVEMGRRIRAWSN